MTTTRINDKEDPWVLRSDPFSSCAMLSSGQQSKKIFRHDEPFIGVELGRGTKERRILFFILEAHHGPLLGSFENWTTKYTKTKLYNANLDW